MSPSIQRALLLAAAFMYLLLSGCSNSTAPESGGDPAGVKAPTFSPPAGQYSEPQSVVISSTTAGATIHYTTDGSAPSPATGTEYTAPISVSETQTLKAIAFQTGMTASSVVSAAYTIAGSEVVAMPTFDLPAGSYEGVQMVAVSTTTIDASINYTTDGSDPTESTGTSYSTPVSISESQTLKAVAFKTGMTPSSIASADYTITGPPAPALYDWNIQAHSGFHRGVWTAPTGETYIVGNRYMQVDRGSGWEHEPVVDFAFTGLHGTAADNIYGSGGSGKLANTLHRIYHYDGNSWSPAYTGSGTMPVLDIFAVGNSVFAARWGGAYQYDGATWSSNGFGAPGEIMQGVYARAADDAFIVGDKGSIYHWDGGAWSKMDINNGVQLHAVHGAPGGTHVFAVGNNGFIYRWDGTAWEYMNSGVSNALRSVYAISDTDVYAVGDRGDITHFDGTSWSPQVSNTNFGLYDVASSGSGMVAIGSRGEIVRKVNGIWTPENIRLPAYPYGVGGLSTSDIWAVGEFGGIAHYDGSNWSAIDSGAINNIRGVMAFAEDDVWFVGDQSSVWHWDGSSMSMAQLGTGGYLRGIWGIAPDDMWAGDFNHWDGTSWTRIPPDGIHGEMTTIWGTASDNVYGVGSGINSASTVFHWDGTEWTMTDLGKQANMAGIWGSGPNDIFAATQSGGDIFHFDGTSWTEMDSPYASFILSISGTASNNVFAAGADGVMFHYDGATWQPYDSGLSVHIHQMVMFSATSGVAVNRENGVVIQYGP